jgi:hypothetical protein
MRGDSDQSVGPIPECILQSDPWILRRSASSER